MKALFQAIQTKFSAEPHNDLYTALNGHMALAHASQAWSMPYGVYLLVSNVPMYTFDDDEIENARIQISLFSDDPAATEITNLYDYADALYQHCQLSISGHNHLIMERIDNQLLCETDENGNFQYWHYIIEYRVQYE